jgi:hypothetical protein
MSGSVPLPMEPKPTMTIGPLMRAYTGAVDDGIKNLRIVGTSGRTRPLQVDPLKTTKCR